MEFNNLPLHTQVAIAICRPMSDDVSIFAWYCIAQSLSADNLLNMQLNANKAYEMQMKIEDLRAELARTERIIHPWVGASKEWDYMLRHLVKTTVGREEAKERRQELTKEIDSLAQKHGKFVTDLVNEIIVHIDGAKMAAAVRKEMTAVAV